MFVPNFKALVRVGIFLLLVLLALAGWLLRPLPVKPVPAKFHCYDLKKGTYVPLDPPPEVFAIGLSYAKHIEETASEFDPAAVPPVFRKHPRVFVRSGAEVAMPDAAALRAAADELEPGLGETLREEFPGLSPLLDYEGELGLVLLDDIDPKELAKADFVPRIGFFITNDLSARTLAILGEDQANRFDYWGVSKSFPGFMPVGDRAWVPDEPKADGIPSIVIETTVNGEVRQKQSTDQLIYTPLQVLRFVHSTYPESPLRKGTIVLTGTPGGVALKAPRWLMRAGDMVGLSRFKKLEIKLGSDISSFLESGDRVEVSGGGLGSVSVTITDRAVKTRSEPE